MDCSWALIWAETGTVVAWQLGYICGLSGLQTKSGNGPSSGLQKNGSQAGAKLLRLGLVADKLGLTGLGLELAQIGPLVWVMKSLLNWAFWAYKMGLDWTQNGP